MFPVPIIILGIVFALIAVRRIGNIKIQIWQAMLFGALAVLLLGQITPLDALKSINFDVILFLFGMFVIGQALEESGYLVHLSYKLFRKANTVDELLLFILFGMGMASAFLMNDTLAIIGTPLVLFLAKRHGIPPKVLLLALAFAVTIGSAMSPIGNPQNLLIAINGNVKNPFVTFFGYLFLPTIINLTLAYFVLKIFYKEKFPKLTLNHSQEPIKDHGLADLSKFSLILILLLIAIKIVVVTANLPFDFRMTYIALIPMLPILVFSKKRVNIVKKIDWYTLIFFVSMFILMQSVWDTGFFQNIINNASINIASIPVILTISVLLSQLISNVPMVALFLPLLIRLGASSKAMIALAAGSTIAGNLFILGAASNVIIIQNAEKKANETLTFWEFSRIGILLTILNVLIYWIFLVLI